MPPNLGCSTVPAGREGSRKKSEEAGLEGSGLTDPLLGLGTNTASISWESKDFWFPSVN